MILTYDFSDRNDNPDAYVADSYVPLFMRGLDDKNDDITFELISGSLHSGLWASTYVYAVTYTYKGYVIINYNVFNHTGFRSAISPSMKLVPSADLYLSETIVFSKRERICKTGIAVHGRQVCIEDYGDDIKITTGFETHADYIEWKLSQ